MHSSDWAPNRDQERAIAHGAGPLRIQAGAGSGKTTTLGHRICALVERGLCRADQILVLTFTTKAVEDLRRKVAGLLGTDGAQPRIDTYHAFALSLVREFAERLGLPTDPVLLTEAPLKVLMRQQIDRLGLERQDLTRIDKAVATVVDFAGWHRHEGSYLQTVDALLERLGPEEDRDAWVALLHAYAAYRGLLREKGAVDYDDLIALAVGVLASFPDVAAAVQARFPYLLVDEYQDTDWLQGEMVRLVAGEAANVTIVGDPDQTIYSFRGAAMTNIRDFAHVDMADVAMLTNYRSTPEILAAANAVIQQNQRRKPELLVAARESGIRPQLLQAPDWVAEAAWLAAEVAALRTAGVRLADIAVLVRKNGHKAGIHAALMAAGIPVQVVGGMDLFADPEAVRCLGYIRAIAAPDDDGAVSVALSMPRYGLSDRDVAALARQRLQDERLVDVVTRVAPGDARLQSFLDEFWPLYSMQFAEGCQAAVRAAITLHAGGLAAEVRAGVEGLVDLADAFFARPDLFTGRSGAGGLALFAEYLSALRTVGDPMDAVQFDSDQDAVKLMTVHTAKGLEFPVVFVPRLTAADFAPKADKWSKPFPLAWHHDREFAANVEAMMAEEERRLFYVAVTRAMDRLYLSWAPVDPARKRPLKCSPFLDEVAAVCDAVAVPPAGAAVAAGYDVLPVIESLVSAAAVAPQAGRGAAGGASLAAAGALAVALPEVLSFSHLQTYQLCPYRFYLQHLLQLPGRPNRAADTGVRVHAAIERLAALGDGGGASYAEFAAWAGAASAPVDAERGALDAEQVEPVGNGPAGDGHVDPLRAFWESEYAATPALASEQEFFLRVGTAVIRGFIDRIHPLAGGGVEVVDFKTYSRLQSEAEVKAGLQLPLYLLACRQALGHPDARDGALFFLKHGKVVRVRYTDEELEEARRRAEGLVAAIEARDWAPTPDAGVCGFCPYRDGCPVARTTSA